MTTSQTEIINRISETYARLPLTAKQRELVRGIGSPREYRSWADAKSPRDVGLCHTAAAIENYREAVGRTAKGINDLADYYISLAVDGVVSAIGREAKDHIEAWKVMAETKAYILGA